MAEPAFVLTRSDALVVQVECWDGAEDRLRAELARTLGVDLPATVGETSRHDGVRAIRIAPRRLWLLHDRPRDPAPTVDPELGCILPLAEGRTRLHLAGRDVRALLQRCLAVDLDSAAAAPGRALQTALHGASVLLLRTGAAECELLVPRSHAASVSEWISPPRPGG